MKRGDASPQRYQVKSYILRLRHRPAGFSVEVRPLTSGKNQTFKTLRQLFAYLEAEAAEESNPENERR